MNRLNIVATWAMLITAVGHAYHSCRSWSAIPAPRETGTQRTNLPQDLQHFLRSTCTCRCTYTRACTEHVYVIIHVPPTEVAAIYPDGEVEVFLQNRHTTITMSLSRVSNKLEIQCVNTLGVLGVTYTEVSFIQITPRSNKCNEY